MKKKNILLLIIAVFLLAVAAVLVISLVTAGKNSDMELNSTDLMEGIRAEKVQATEELGDYGPAVMDFSLGLFRNTMEPGENSLVSPLSVLSALGMTVNGADGETLAEMESTLGMTTGQVNEFLYSFMAEAEERETSQLHLANAIWMKEDEGLRVEEDFLKINAAYYDAGVYKAPFNEGTKEDINAWVKEKTKDMIPEILNELPEEAVLYLVNALAFEAQWENIYYDIQVHERTFTTESGQQQTMEMMYGSEGQYLEDDYATGFMKYYKGRQYAFVALLPNEGVTVAEYVGSLTGEGLYEMLSNPEQAYVETGLAKFSMDCGYELQEALRTMGMETAFELGSANFDRLGTHENGPLYISRILHKTYISVTEDGTRAAAATLEELPAGEPPNPKEVYLDRPFLYLIIECESCTPLFMGTVMTME